MPNRAYWEAPETEIPFRPDLTGWWEKPKDKGNKEETRARANSLVSCCRNIENMQRDLHEQNLWNAQLYSNRELAAFDWGQGSLYRASLAPISRVGENLTLTIVDTLVAQIGKNRPKATPVTRGASWKTRLAAKRLDKFLYGEFLRNRVYDLGKQIFRDACVFGLGAAYVYVEEDEEGADGGTGARVCVDRVFPDEIVVDQVEVVATGRPRHIYRRRVLPAEVVAATYGVEIKDLLEGSTGATYLDYRPQGSSWIVLVDGWQLAHGGLPGRYMCATPGVVLADEPWDYDWAPFVFYRWHMPLAGFYSPSVVEQALPYQIRLNEVCEVIRESQDLMARPRIFVQEGSRINPLELDNAVGRIIKYTGALPEPMVWAANATELLNERDRCWTQALAAFGISQMASMATAPTSGTRFDSSKALREYNSVQDDRLADPAQRYERWYLDLAEQMVRCIKASGKSPKTMWISGGKKARVETIEWDEIDLDDSAYVLQLEASSVYNMTPAAQQDEIFTALAQGRIDEQEFKRLTSHPDLDNQNSIAAAAAEDIDRVIELLEDGKYEAPTGVQDLIQGVQRVTLAYLQLGKYDNVPDEVKLAFIDWLTAARAELERGTEDAEPPPMGMAPAQPGMEAPGTGTPLEFAPPAPMQIPGAGVA